MLSRSHWDCPVGKSVVHVSHAGRAGILTLSTRSCSPMTTVGSSRRGCAGSDEEDAEEENFFRREEISLLLMFAMQAEAVPSHPFHPVALKSCSLSHAGRAGGSGFSRSCSLSSTVSHAGRGRGAFSRFSPGRSKIVESWGGSRSGLSL